MNKKLQKEILNALKKKGPIANKQELYLWIKRDIYFASKKQIPTDTEIWNELVMLEKDGCVERRENIPHISYRILKPGYLRISHLAY